MELEVVSGVAALLGVERWDDGAQFGISFGIVPGDAGHRDVIRYKSLLQGREFFRGRGGRRAVDLVFPPSPTKIP